MEDEVLGELLGEIKSSRKLPDIQQKRPKLCPAAKPAPASSGPINPFRATGIRRPKRPLADSASENFDSDIKDFEDDGAGDVTKPTQSIDDFGDDADFDASDLMEIDEVTTQEIEREKENRFVFQIKCQKYQNAFDARHDQRLKILSNFNSKHVEIAKELNFNGDFE
jgi:hypothetical protein